MQKNTTHTPDARKKMSRAHRGKAISRETRKKIRNTLLGFWREVRELRARRPS